MVDAQPPNSSGRADEEGDGHGTGSVVTLPVAWACGLLNAGGLSASWSSAIARR